MTIQLPTQISSVTVVGGGRVGRELIKQLIDCFPALPIVLLDARASELKRRYPDLLGSVASRDVNIGHSEDLARALGGTVVFNVAGPFNEFGDQILQKCIERKIPYYIDVCDESKPLEVMRGLNDYAKAAGTLAIIGCGFSPGFPNVVIGSLHRSGFEFTNAEIAWCTSMADPVGRAAAAHAMHIIRAPARQLVDGKLIEVESLKNHRTVEFPPPFGKLAVFDIEHSEPVTLAASISTLRSVWVGGTILPVKAIHRLKAFVDIGLAEAEPLSIDGHSCSRDKIVSALEKEFWSKQDLKGAYPECAVTMAKVAGATIDQERCYALTGSVSTLTASGAFAAMTSLNSYGQAIAGVQFSEEFVVWTHYLMAVKLGGGTIHRRVGGAWNQVSDDDMSLS